jgi:hypothetical protein
VVTDPTRLCGAWRLTRRVVDRASGVAGMVAGQLIIRPVGRRLSWQESGLFSWRVGGRTAGVPPSALRTVSISRQLFLAETGGSWGMTFSDGRPFHPWILDRAVVHPCAEDTYSGLIRVDESGTRMRTLWDVIGPAKDQRLITSFSLIPAVHE